MASIDPITKPVLTKLTASLVAGALLLGACGTDVALPTDDTEPDSLALVDESTTTEPEVQDGAPDEESDPTFETTPTDPPAQSPTTAASSETAPPADPAPTTAPTTAPAPATEPGENTDQLLELAEGESLRLINELRESVGLGALTRSAEMDNFARTWSQAMARSSFEHSEGPYGENIAWTSATFMPPDQVAAEFNENWINSPGHYANMTSGDYTQIGVGFWNDEKGWHATHVFQ